ncbi:UNVERIFIED_CONTAM: hypothetical protein K2H54_001010 [Gekko kuhli]
MPTTCLLEEETDMGEPLLEQFGRMRSRVTTQLKGLHWGKFPTETQETWAITLESRWESRYDWDGELGYIPEDVGAGQESVEPEGFVEIRLQLLERGQDQIMQMVEASLQNMLHSMEHPKSWAEKFVLNWGHLFPGNEHRVDYTASQLREGAADWYVSLHTILHSIHPVSLLAWMREAADADSHLRTIRIDNAATLGKRIPAMLKPKTPSRQKKGVREQRMKQGLCLKCGEAGNFTATCPEPGTLSAAKKGLEKKWVDTLSWKSVTHPKTQ